MSNDHIFRDVTASKSTTFYFASLFFAKNQRQDVFKLYSYLRHIDDIADINKDLNLLHKAKQTTYDSIAGAATENIFIAEFASLYKKYNFEKEWVNAFFWSMEFDLAPDFKVTDIVQFDKYVYGVADVVGLMMCQILGLPKAAHGYACSFGAGMQIVNILRDIAEDYANGRVYIPVSILRRHATTELDPHTIAAETLTDIVREMADLAQKKLGTASGGYIYFDKSTKVAIKTCLSIYTKILEIICRNPVASLKRKTKLSKPEVLWIAVKEWVSVYVLQKN